jgi:hypothetical protein
MRLYVGSLALAATTLTTTALTTGQAQQPRSADARGAAFIEGRFDGTHYIARIGIQTAPLILPRLGADAKSVRFERQ